MVKKRLKKDRQRGMSKRHGKKTMSVEQKESLKKLRDYTKVANEVFKAKHKAEKN